MKKKGKRTSVGSLSWVGTFLAAALLAGTAARADGDKIEIRVATAADMRVALNHLIEVFQSKSANVTVTPVLGASGSLTSEISSGAPYDLFFSADKGYPETLSKNGFIEGEPRVYGRGVLVLWVKNDSTVDLKQGLKALGGDSVKKIAVANPAHAPFGRAAISALKKENVWPKVEKKLVTAENVGQAAQFAVAGAANAALIALSLASQAPLSESGRFVEIPAADYPPLDQAAAVMKKSAHQKEARAFLDFALSGEGRKILLDAGLREPGTEK